MGTNYYAHWRISPADSDSPWGIVQQPLELTLHICKSLRSFQGAVFNSWDAWKNFLTSNQHAVTIRDEYGLDIDLDTFVTEVEATEPTDRRRQHQWLLDHGHLLDGDWLDRDGFSFHRGEFS
jgi:hypothetical protein